MHVGNVMLKKDQLLILESSTTIQAALEIIEGRGFLTLPVVEKGVFKGCISTYDIYREFYRRSQGEVDQLKSEAIKDYIRRDIPVLESDQIIEDASVLFAARNIPFIPVVNKNSEIEGIVTHKALFNALSNLFGYHKGIRMTVHSPEVKGRISSLSQAIKKADGNIISLVVNDLDVFTKLKEIIVRFEAENLELVKENVEKEGFRVIEIIK